MSILSGLFRSRDKPTDSTTGSAYRFLFGGSTSGKMVTERSSMQMTAVYSCVRILAEAVAGLPLQIYRYTEDGSKEKAIDHSLYFILHDEPNPEMTSFVFRETLMTHLLLWGNAYAQIIRNGKGEVVALYPLMPNRMTVALEFKDDGEDVLDSDDEAEEGNDTAATPLTLEQRLYKKLMVFAAPILNGEAHYMKLKSEGFEDLVLEAVGNEYSIAHYYKQSGDAMHDPEITFTIDHENKSIHPTSYLQDDMGVFYETDAVSPAMVMDLKGFMSEWFTNIKNQGFAPVDVRNYEQESEAEMER